MTVTTFSTDQLQLLKNTICRGSTDEEFQLFAHACRKTGLDPFMKQIYAVKRYDSGLKKEVMSIQVGIDGLRAIADKSGNYAPGKETMYSYDKDGKLLSATAYVKKRTKDGTWHDVSATAFYNEYVAKTRDGSPTHMWASKEHIMLSKCAESLALRKAFPYELSGVYTHEEMSQADNKVVAVEQDVIEERIIISKEQAQEIESLLAKCNSDYAHKILKSWRNLGFDSADKLPLEYYERVKKALLENIKSEIKFEGSNDAESNS